MKKPYFFAAISVLCWSTVATIVKLLLGELTSMQVLCLSSLFAFSFLLIFNLATGNIKKLRAYRPRDYLLTVLIGLPGTFLYYVFYYSGTARLPASEAFIINYLWPIMSVIFAILLLRERVTARKLVAILLSFLGVVIAMARDLLRFDTDAMLGALFCVLGAISYGVFTALNQKTHYDKRISMMFFYFVTFLLTLTITLSSGGFPSLRPIQIAGFAFNGIFTMAIANTMWMLALEGAHNTARVSNLAYLTPFLSLLWTTLFLKEEFHILSLVGLSVIVGGILIQNYKGHKDRPKIKTKS